MPNILVVNNAEPGILEFALPFEKIIGRAGSTSEIIDYADSGNFELNTFDGVILTGSPQGDDIIEHHSPYFQWIKTFGKPVLGICAGHHITGFIYGSKILRSEEPESGDFEVSIIKPDPLLKDCGNKFLVKQMHNDSITLPNNFVQLATSKTCKNQMMKHQDKPHYTCQFHPEYYNHNLILNFIKLCSSVKHLQ